MNLPDPMQVTAEELSAAQVSPDFLANVASVRPDLWQSVLNHPACYPGLTQWILAQQQQKQQQQDSSPQWNQGQPQAGFSQQTAPQIGEWGQPGQPQSQQAPGDGQFQEKIEHATQKVGAVAGQAAAGTKEFYSSQVKPATSKLASDVKEAIKSTDEVDGPRPRVRKLVCIVTFVACCLGIISLFLPAFKVFGFTVNYFYQDVQIEGICLLILFLCTAAFSVATMQTGKKWANITTIVFAALVSVMGLFDSVGASSRLSQFFGLVDIGVGLILLGLCATVLLLCAIALIIFRVKTSPEPQGAPGWNGGNPNSAYNPQYGNGISQPVVGQPWVSATPNQDGPGQSVPGAYNSSQPTYQAPTGQTETQSPEDQGEANGKTE